MTNSNGIAMYWPNGSWRGMLGVSRLCSSMFPVAISLYQSGSLQAGIHGRGQPSTSLGIADRELALRI